MTDSLIIDNLPYLDNLPSEGAIVGGFVRTIAYTSSGSGTAFAYADASAIGEQTSTDTRTTTLTQNYRDASYSYSNASATAFAQNSTIERSRYRSTSIYYQGW
jgi:hypothetical protein